MPYSPEGQLERSDNNLTRRPIVTNRFQRTETEIIAMKWHKLQASLTIVMLMVTTSFVISKKDLLTTKNLRMIKYFHSEQTRLLNNQAQAKFYPE
jgi:hypothetical protein